MLYSRRTVLALGSGTLAAATLSSPASATLDHEAILQFTGGASIVQGGIELVVPPHVDDGHAVPLQVSALGASAIAIFALDNPNQEVVRFRFGPIAANSAAATKIRLANSQDVIAIARLEDGTFRSTVAPVSVTVGGCNV